jgi:serine protease AprX
MISPGKALLSGLGASVLLTGLLAAPSPAAGTEHPSDVIVTLRATADLSSLGRSGTQRARREEVLRALRTTAQVTQTGLRQQLAALENTGDVSDVRPFWITNAIALTATPHARALLQRRADVASVEPEQTFAAPAAATVTTIEPNLEQIGAPTLWDQGVTGGGAVVAVLDTGVDVDHPDLSPTWRGGTNSWFDPYQQHPTVPTDRNGHGTWTTGVVVGGGAGGSAIGVAPGARWIAAKIFDDSGKGTTSGIHAALQWAADPDDDPATDDGADVVNNSWTFGAPGCDLEFQPDLVAFRALDVVPVFAAGNGGPYPQSSYSPANYPEALSVGAVDATDGVLADSSRGPSTCGGRSRAYPDVVAPGAAIRTSDVYGLWTSVTGTSLAAPHVAGALALLVSEHTALGAAEQQDALLGGARDLGATGPDETYGAGRVDIPASHELLASRDAEPPTVTDVEASPNPAAGVATVTMTATAADVGGVASASVTESGARVPSFSPTMDAADGAFGGPTEALTATLDVSGWSAGEHLLRVSATDTSGNVSPVATVPVVVGPGDLVFGDGFESGGTGRWSSLTGAGNITVTQGGAPVGLTSMQVTVSGRHESYVQDDSPAGETTYRAAFWMDGGQTLSSGHDVLTGLSGTSKTVLAVSYRGSADGMELRVGALAKKKVDWSTWTSLPPGQHRIEVDWTSGPTGTAGLTVDDNPRVSTAPAPDDLTLDAVRLGAGDGLDAKSAGQQTFDAFASSLGLPLNP